MSLAPNRTGDIQVMTRADFQALALALNRTHASFNVVKAIERACAASNPRFDAVSFYRAVGMEVYAQGLEHRQAIAANIKAVHDTGGHDANPYSYCPDCKLKRFEYGKVEGADNV
jgi:hypothetical protein